jgi:hypothetical protein
MESQAVMIQAGLTDKTDYKRANIQAWKTGEIPINQQREAYPIPLYDQIALINQVAITFRLKSEELTTAADELPDTQAEDFTLPGNR